MSSALRKISVVTLALTLLLSTPSFVRTPHTAFAQGGGNGKIVFESYRDGNWEIYVMDEDGSNQTNLTNNAAEDAYPDWSPDGTKIAFMSERDGNGEIYVMDADGANPTNLTNNAAYDISGDWSPDGTHIAFKSNRDGNWEIYVIDADGSNQTNLTNNAAYDDNPVWSPDGTRIAFNSNRDGNQEIYVMNADGSNPTRLTNYVGYDLYPIWSPDGTQIAFYSTHDGNYEIYVMNADGSNQTNLTNHAANDISAVWSPDGTRIAFSSDRDGNYEIYIMSEDGSNPARLTNNMALDQYPDWYDDTYVEGCLATAPATAYQGDQFTLTLGCQSISSSVFGFQAGHTITMGASLVTAQAGNYTAGTIFQGQQTLAGPNTLPLYALSLQAGGTQATGNFTLGSVNYTAVAPGQTTFDLTNLILGDINGNALPNVVAPTTLTTITINDLVLSLSGTVDPEGYADTLTFALDGNPTYSGLTPTYNAANGTTAFTYSNIKGHPASLVIDGPSHVACQETLTFPVDAGNEVLPRTLILRAGDVNSDNEVDIVDAAAIGQGYGQAPTGELDINHDGAVNILDLIHVGRNYGVTGPTDCTP